MADNLERVQLARLAHRLVRSGRLRVPPLVFFTDDERLPDPLPSIRSLPRGAMVVLRHRNVTKRRALACAVERIARERRLLWLIANDAPLAAELGANGIHLPESAIAHTVHWRARRPDWIITCAAHSDRACARASVAGVNAIFLAPVFATPSHPGRRVLGPLRTCLLAARAVKPIYALGGINPYTARRLVGSRISGVAAIGALAVP